MRGPNQREEQEPEATEERRGAAPLLLTSTFLAAAPPSLGSIIPTGGQRGTELELNFNGDRLADVKEVLFYSPGFSLVEFKVTNPKHVLAKIKIRWPVGG